MRRLPLILRSALVENKFYLLRRAYVRFFRPFVKILQLLLENQLVYQSRLDENQPQDQGLPYKQLLLMFRNVNFLLPKIVTPAQYFHDAMQWLRQDLDKP